MADEDRHVLVDHLEEENEDGDGQDTAASSRHRRFSIDDSNLPPSNKAVYLASVIAAIGGVLFGYDVGVISGAKVQVAHVMKLTCGQEESLVSFMPLGALSASLLASKILNRFGRKWCIQLTAVVFTVGSLMMACANSFVVLLVGRFIVGFGVSLSAMAECLYISEIAKPKERGMLVSLNELGITIGFLLAFLVNYILMDTRDGWRVMFGISSVLSVIQLVWMYWLPRTPHFLLLHQRDSEAIEVLRSIYPATEVKQEMVNIRLSVEMASESSCSQLFDKQDNVLHRSMVGLTLVLFLQITGQPNILYYATDIFEAVGFCGESLAASATVGLGLMKVASTILSLLLVDKVGRRKLLLVGSSCMAVCLFALTIFAGYEYSAVGYHHRESCSHADDSFFNNSESSASFTTEVPYESNISDHIHKNMFSHIQHFNDNVNITSLCDDETNKLPFGLRYLAFVALVLYVAAFSLSFGPVTWILLTELFPVSLKGQAMSMGQAVNWTANVFVSVTFLDAVRVLTLPLVFFMYLLFAVLSIIFIYKFVPETKGKSLEEISNMLKNPKSFNVKNSYSRKLPEAYNTADFMKLQDSNF